MSFLEGVGGRLDFDFDFEGAGEERSIFRRFVSDLGRGSRDGESVPELVVEDAASSSMRRAFRFLERDLDLDLMI